MANSVSPLPSKSAANQSGKLLGGLTLVIYLGFLFLPNSPLQVMAWPFSLLWLTGLLFGALWGLTQLQKNDESMFLGRGLDVAIAFTFLACIVCTIVSRWPTQGAWMVAQLWMHILVLYGLRQWLRTSENRLWTFRFMGGLGGIFALYSLLGWAWLILLPNLAKQGSVAAAGFALNYVPLELTFQNSFPLFHQNYVAGFLLLVLPCTAALMVLNWGTQKRWLWVAGVALEGVALLTTQSRGGAMGAIVMLGCLLLIGASRWLRSGRSRVITVGAFLGGVVALVLLNPRLSSTLSSLMSGNFRPLSFRAIAVEASMSILSQHPFFGTGPGTAAWMFPAFRPAWSGLEAPVMLQLHSLPLQVMAELGGLGILVMLVWLVTLCWLGWQLHRQWGQIDVFGDRLWGIALGLGLIGFGVESLTDYQLDVPAISLLLVAMIAGVASLEPEVAVAMKSSRPEQKDGSEGTDPDVSQEQSILHQSTRPHSSNRSTIASVAGVLLLLISLSAIIPRYWAWGQSSAGLEAYFDNDFARAETALVQAESTFPQDPFYPLQLGWLHSQQVQASPNPQASSAYYERAISAFERAYSLLPNDEYLSTNLGYLLLPVNPSAAIQYFQHSLSLNPVRAHLALGLGLAYSGHDSDSDRVIAMFARETLRHPAFITATPIFQETLSPEDYAQYLGVLDQTYQELIEQYPEQSFLRTNYAAILWWRGELTAASDVLQGEGPGLLQAILLAEAGDISGALMIIDNASGTPGFSLLRAVLVPQDRPARSAQLASIYPNALWPPLTETINSIREWLAQPNAIVPYRSDRTYVIQSMYRRTDGPRLTDTFTIPLNWTVAEPWRALFRTPKISVDLDRELAQRFPIE